MPARERLASQHLTPGRAQAARRWGRAFPALRTWGLRLLGAFLLGSAMIVLWREFRQLSLQEVGQRIGDWGALRVAAAVGLSAINFSLVGVIEWLGLRWSGTPLPWRTALLRSFMVNGLIHTLGANVVTATLTRSWIYRRAGLRLMPSATTTAFAAVSFVAGVGALAAAGLLAATPEQLRAAGWAVQGARTAAGLLAAGIGGYLGVCAVFPAARLFGDVRLPPFGYAVAQVVIGAVDNAVSASMLWLLIGPGAAPYATFVFAYAVSCLAGVLSAVPGGFGVLEGALVVLAPHMAPERLAAGFLGFRLFSYLLPLVLALLLVGIELCRRPREAP